MLAGAILALVAAYTVSVLPGMPGRPGTSALGESWVRSAAYASVATLCLARALLVTADRCAWLALSAAPWSYTAGSVGFGIVYDGAEEVPYVSFADALWLAFYPLAYVALILLVRGRARHFHRSTWLDGLVAGLAAAAFSAAIAFDVLEAGGRAVAVAFGFRTRSVYHLYNMAFDPDVQAASPGAMLVGTLVEHAIRDELARFDFMRGRERYKLEFGASRADLRRLRVWAD